MSSQKKSSEPTTMADLLASAEHKIRGVKTSDKVKGKIISKNSKSVFIDIGGKTEGVVTEKAFAEAKDYISGLKPGDEVTATVLIPETKDGYTLLSLRAASFDASWDKLSKAKESKEAVAIMGRSVNPSGISVDVEGIGGFIPTSLLGKEVAKNPSALIGRYFKAVVIEVSKDANKVVLSEKEVSEAKDIKAAKEALSKIKDGEIYDGEVTTVASFGCFVKINLGTDKKPVGVEGLVHVSELAWGKVETPLDVVKEGDKVKVKVIGIKDGKLALSIKQAGKNPWEEAEKKYKPETKVTGKIVRSSDFGTFVELEPGIEGLIHLTKIPPGTKLVEGQEVNVYVEEIDTKAKKLSLGLVLTTKPIGYK